MFAAALGWILIAAVAVMAAAPDAPLGRWLRRNFVERPADLISRIKLRKVLLWIAILPVLTLVLVAAPELLVLMSAMGDIGLALELLLLVWAASVASGFRSMRTRLSTLGAGARRLVLRLFARRSRTAGRERRSRSERPPGGNTPDEEPGFAYA